MTLINEIAVWGKNVEEPNRFAFKQITSIVAENSVGKTLLALLIQFALGSDTVLDKLQNRREMSFFDKITILLNDSSGNAHELARDLEHCYIVDGESYSMVSSETYVSRIKSIVGENKEFADTYYALAEENISYRKLFFLNYISQTHCGDITNIFSEYWDDRFRFGIKDIMFWLFSYEKALKIANYSSELRERQNRVKNAAETRGRIREIEAQLNDHFSALRLPYVAGKYENNKITFKRYYENATFPAPGNGRIDKSDLGSLMSSSRHLASEIEMFKAQQREVANFKTSRAGKAASLEVFQRLAENDATSRKYIPEIISQLQSASREISFLSDFDYEGRIKELKAEKERIDSKIGNRSRALSDTEIQDDAVHVAAIRHLLERLNSCQQISSSDDEKRIADLRKEIKKLRAEMINNKFEDLNHEITKLYCDIQNCSFIEADKRISGFQIALNPLKLSLAICADSSDEGATFFEPGSLARKSVLQMCAYAVLLTAVSEKLDHKLVLPLLLFDSPSSHVDSDKYSNVHRTISDYCLEHGIQLIDIIGQNASQSVQESPSESIVDLNGGLIPGCDC